MQIQQIHVEGFGTLSNTRLSPLGSGLTILYGNNGTGKTTVLEFVRGVLCGFNHSRRLRLLPPIKEGTPGGSLTIQTSQGEFDVIRHARTDGSDTLAILQQQGSKNDVSHLRQTIQDLDEQAIRSLFMVSGYDALNLNGMAHLAQRYGIELQTQRSSATWISPRIEELQTERSALYHLANSEGELAQLDQRRDQLTSSLQNVRLVQQKAITEWRNAIQELKFRLDRLRRESNWLIQEQGAVESDLTETQTRLWSTRETVVEEQETVEQIVPKPAAQWKAEIAEIDREIANAQQVLRDLAGSRMEISVTKAGLAGAETPDPAVTFDRQRSALSTMEIQTGKLLELASQLKAASECLCGARSESLEQVTQELRSQIWFLCQELSRQQTAQQQWLLQTQREGVDGCEQELTRQIRRLRIRRDELLQRHTSSTSEQIHFQTKHESEWCRCEGHEQALQHGDLEPEFMTTTQVVTRTRTVLTSAARPGDAELERALKERLNQLFQQSQQALSRLRELEAELVRLQQTPPDLSQDHTIQNLRNELELVNQQLANGRATWHSLKWTETILEQTQSRLHVEVIPTVIQEASALLSKMTSGRSTGVRFDADEAEM
ncbi:MAG TPA: AAA family ATPase, partial [Planctomicrobium sp.]|nr:AAA family ATPase [Planctomicrobium sp.]